MITNLRQACAFFTTTSQIITILVHSFAPYPAVEWFLDAYISKKTEENLLEHDRATIKYRGSPGYSDLFFLYCTRRMGVVSNQTSPNLNSNSS